MRSVNRRGRLARTQGNGSPVAVAAAAATATGACVEGLEARQLFAATPPTVIIQAPTGEPLDQWNPFFRYQVGDSSGLASIDVTITRGVGPSSAVVYHQRLENVPNAANEVKTNQFGLGQFTMTIVATDRDPVEQSSTTASHTFTVVDDDKAAPAISIYQPPPDATLNDSAAPPPFTYEVRDASNADVTWVLTRDGVQVDTGTSEVGRFDVPTAGRGLGQFTLTVTAVDRDNEFPDDSLSSELSRTFTIVDDDTTGPTIDFFSPTVTSLPDSANAPRVYNYRVVDGSGVAETTWVLTRNGQQVDTGSGGADVDVPFTQYGAGVFELIVTATDADNDRTGDQSQATDSFVVTVYDDDTTGPTIDFYAPTVTSLPDSAEAAPRFFNYRVVDGSGVAGTTWILTRNGTQVDQGSGGADVDVDFSAFGTGDFVLTVTATDADGDGGNDAATATKSSPVVTVYDDDTTGPTIDFYDPTTNGVPDSANAPRVYNYRVVDGSGVAETTWVLTRNGQQVDTGSGGADVDVPFTQHGAGVFELTVTATDADNDRADDQSQATDSFVVTVFDDDTAGPAISFFDGLGATVQESLTPRTFAYEALDDSGVANVDWVLTRDGATVAAGRGAAARATVDFTSYGVGTFTLSVTARDGDVDWAGDASSNSVSKTVQVVAVPPPPRDPPPADTNDARLLDDPLNAGRKMIVVRGTNGDDCILVSRAFKVTINGTVAGTFTGSNPSRIVVYGLDGNDKIWTADGYTSGGDSDDCVHGRVTGTQSWLFGGKGNDLLVTGNSGGVVVGGEGRDIMLGGAGRELLIGGRGADIVTGVSADDILVAGYTSHDANEAALGGILKEWSRTDRSYENRVKALKGELTTGSLNGAYYLKTEGTAATGQTVFDDGARDEVDILIGLGGQDWYLYNTGADGGASDIVLLASAGSVKSDIDAS